jgi:hypothetical protein
MMFVTVVGAAVKVFCFYCQFLLPWCAEESDTYSLVRSNSSSNSNRRRIRTPLYQIPLINSHSSPRPDIRQTLLNANIAFWCGVSSNVHASGYLDQTGPSGAWRVGLLGARGNGAAGCCGACVDYCRARPGFECAG